MEASDITLEGAWNAYRHAAIPEHAPPVQVDAMRQAFLAGLCTLSLVELASRRMPRAQAEKLLDGWCTEADAQALKLAQQPSGS